MCFNPLNVFVKVSFSLFLILNFSQTFEYQVCHINYQKRYIDCEWFYFLFPLPSPMLVLKFIKAAFLFRIKFFLLYIFSMRDSLFSVHYSIMYGERDRSNNFLSVSLVFSN